MGRFADSWRSHLLTTFSGDSDGRPHWVDQIEQGDDAGFFGPGSASWAVHGGMATMVAGIRALLMQTLHPGAMAGVHDWSRYREDPLGRLSGT
ncbi:MAG TPA: oxygenase MpaB family protein, partial [Cryobacterium sp.]|nr:oxygenase MpaB family protein [Cryobacterium sp.]